MWCLCFHLWCPVRAAIVVASATPPGPFALAHPKPVAFGASSFAPISGTSVSNYVVFGASIYWQLPGLGIYHTKVFFDQGMLRWVFFTRVLFRKYASLGIPHEETIRYSVRAQEILSMELELP